MKDLQQLLYPWVQYYCIKDHITNIQTVCSPWDIEINAIDPYFMYPVKKIFLNLILHHLWLTNGYYSK